MAGRPGPINWPGRWACTGFWDAIWKGWEVLRRVMTLARGRVPVVSPGHGPLRVPQSLRAPSPRPLSAAVPGPAAPTARVQQRDSARTGRCGTLNTGTTGSTDHPSSPAVVRRPTPGRHGGESGSRGPAITASDARTLEGGREEIQTA